jgi:hypothetical protein
MRDMKYASRILIGLLIVVSCAVANAQFIDDFETLSLDPDGVEGWSFFSGDGDATMDFLTLENSSASILVDATGDRRNVWWALIKRKVSEHLDLERLGRPGWELRVTARIRASDAPRRVNLHVNTQRTTDFHSHLVEFDIPDAGTWHTISMTTRDFPVEPGDTVFAQMALMDWGLGRYRVDVDEFKVDMVEVSEVGPDAGVAVPYHPPIPDSGTFEHGVAAAEGAVVDLANRDVNLGGWSVLEGDERLRVLTVGGTLWVILRWDLTAFEGRRVADHGLLELTTHTVQRDAREMKDFGLVRVVEILDGDPSWRRDTVTVASLLREEPLDEVINPQMIIDGPVSESIGVPTRLTISRPVLQRLIDGRTLGLAITPLGSIFASFSARDGEAPRLLFNLEE